MWNERYTADEYVYGTAPNTFLESVANLISAGSRILCLAEGEGRNAVFLARQGHRVVAVDQSSVGLEKAHRLAEDAGVEIETVVADLAEYPIEPGHWDAIISIFCHLPIDLRRQVHAGAVDGLVAGGLFILEAYTPRQLELKTGGPPVVELMMSLDDLKAELTGLSFRHAVEKQREVIEGWLHNGPGAVVQLVGIKE
jgi:SAM-dependent methyltransferase